MPRTILLVDDSKTMREVLKVYLMGQDYDFLDADNGERALYLVRLVPVHLVMVDFKMPQMDGMTFLRELRRVRPAGQKRVPVILVTAQRTPDLEAQAREAGADDFLLKPLDSEVVAEAVERLLGPKRP